MHLIACPTCPPDRPPSHVLQRHDGHAPRPCARCDAAIERAAASFAPVVIAALERRLAFETYYALPKRRRASYLRRLRAAA